ncbi:glutamyl-tRNA synthetase [Aeropyrum pernix]|uniref:Glutamate--tRNA ligase n=1 Tax=Aeropyrum pernix TaxID=56636 RepID=A0A401H7I7_AERPX|nr:glutamate--tRNA ligase [Aeropyrum pernix]GBF08338.1 glutamyl-tRNA synthetase [Aeropyrum pernix]
MGSEDLERLLLGYALRDAVKHGGRASVGSVMSMLLGDYPELRSRAREIASLAARVVEQVNRMPAGEQKRLLSEQYPELARFEEQREKGDKGLPPLPGAVEGRVKLRFAPNPDFVIHMGNARPAIVNHEYARMYRGRMVLRFEDTDPRTKTPLREAYDLIRQDLKWLGVSWDEEYIQSLRMEVFYSVARRAIERGCAYVDNCGREGKELLSRGEYCPTRDLSPEDNLELFEKMLEGEFYEGEAVVRMKTDPRHPNPSLRDWVAMRIIDTEKHPHPLVGSRYLVWPTYNFAVSVDDHMMEITHVLRGKEHQLNTEKQLAVYRCMGWRPPYFIHFGRLKLEGFILSKSKIRKLLEERPGEFMGYDDPRFGTIAGLRRRGVLAEAIRHIILEVGVKPTDATISWANLAAANRKLLDERADRIMYVEDPVEMEVELAQVECRAAEIPFHPNRPQRKRRITVCTGDKVLLTREDAVEGRQLRLMGLSNFTISQGILREVDPSLEYARRMRLPIVQWVKKGGEARVEVLEPVELELRRRQGYAEDAIRGYGVDSHLQFVRYGFVRVDSVEDGVYRVIYTHK